MFKKGDTKSYAMNEMCLATIFIMSVGLNVIWKTCDVFDVYTWSSYILYGKHASATTYD